MDDQTSDGGRLHEGLRALSPRELEGRYSADSFDEVRRDDAPNAHANRNVHCTHDTILLPIRYKIHNYIVHTCRVGEDGIRVNDGCFSRAYCARRRLVGHRHCGVEEEKHHCNRSILYCICDPCQVRDNERRRKVD
jgi:hypothetical protein